MTVKNDYYHILATRGFSLKRLGLVEIALRREDALRAIHTLRELKVSVLGGDVYLEHQGKIEPTFDNWYVDRKESEPHEAFVMRSCVKAESYVVSFPECSGKQLLFVLVPAFD